MGRKENSPGANFLAIVKTQSPVSCALLSFALTGGNVSQSRNLVGPCGYSLSPAGLFSHPRDPSSSDVVSVLGIGNVLERPGISDDRCQLALAA